MGFSVSASFAVAVIAGFIALSMLYPAVSGGFETVSEASQTAGERRLATVNTAINITKACYDDANDEVDIQVENTGTMSLGLNRTHLLLDNVYRLTFNTRDVEGNSNTEVWAPGETLSLNYDYSVQSNIESVPGEPGRVTVATEHGVRDSRGLVVC